MFKTNMKDAHVNIFSHWSMNLSQLLVQSRCLQNTSCLQVFYFPLCTSYYYGLVSGTWQTLSEFLWKEWCVSVFSLLELTVGVNGDMNTMKELSDAMWLKILWFFVDLIQCMLRSQASVLFDKGRKPGTINNTV